MAAHSRKYLQKSSGCLYSSGFQTAEIYGVRLAYASILPRTLQWVTYTYGPQAHLAYQGAKTKLTLFATKPVTAAIFHAQCHSVVFSSCRKANVIGALIEATT